MGTRTSEPDQDAIDGPAKIHQFHRKRNLGLSAGAKSGYENAAESPLKLAYEKGQLIRGNDKYSAQDRFNAGDRYRDIWEAANPKNRDSTNLDIVTGGGGHGITESRADAIKQLICIDSHLKPQDRQIIRQVCAYHEWPSKAVREALGGSYDRAAIPRFNEALDCLIDAMQIAKRASYRSFGS